MMHRYLLATVLIIIMSADLWAQESTFKAGSFFKDFCFKCHSGSVQKGDRQFDGIDLNSLNEQDLTLLEEAINAINRGLQPGGVGKRRKCLENTRFAAAVPTGEADY